MYGIMQNSICAVHESIIPIFIMNYRVFWPPYYGNSDLTICMEARLYNAELLIGRHDDVIFRSESNMCAEELLKMHSF